MTLSPLLPASSLGLLWQRALLISGSGWLMGLGVLSHTAMAQPSSAASDTTSPELVAPPVSTPALPEGFTLPDYTAPPEVVPAAPLPAVNSAVPAPAETSDPFIDRTAYSVGATQRGESVSQGKTQASAPDYAVAASVAPSAVSTFSLPSSGLSWTPGSTTTIGREYFKKTLRSLGRLGNGNIRLLFPLAIPAPITSLFGWRTHPITGDQRFHSGTDLGAPLGTPVLAAYTGRVILADMFGGYGLAIGLEHNKGTQQTLYAHLSEIFVQPGEWVKQGSPIGRVGSTGASTGPHLHFEFRQLTSDGWVAMDAGTQLEVALAELVKSLQVAQTPGAKPIRSAELKAMN